VNVSIDTDNLRREAVNVDGLEARVGNTAGFAVWHLTACTVVRGMHVRQFLKRID
jgi:hypothetical protein